MGDAAGPGPSFGDDMVPLPPRERVATDDEGWKSGGGGRGGRGGRRPWRGNNHFQPYPRGGPPRGFQGGGGGRGQWRGPPPGEGGGRGQWRGPPPGEGGGRGQWRGPHPGGDGGWFPQQHGPRGFGRGRGGGRGRGRGESVFRPAEYWDRRVLENPWWRLEAQLEEQKAAAPQTNPDEIDIDEDDDEMEHDESSEVPKQSTDPTEGDVSEETNPASEAGAKIP